jgi:outer membrane biosynthesis protein TonB
MAHSGHHADLWTFQGRSSRRVELAALGVALLAHLALTRVHPDPAALVPRAAAPLIDVLVDEVPPPPAPEPETPPEPPAPEAASAPTTSPASRPSGPSSPSVSSASAPVASEQAAPVVDSGTEDSDWDLPSGSGTALGRGASGPSGPGGGGLGRAVSLAPRDFSREATPPNLQPYVDRNFPGVARMYKVDGDVVVSALIGTTGAPSDLRVESADPGGKGFGEACSRSVLQGPAWKPKLTKDGTPLASRVSFRCKFRLTEAERNATTPSVGGRVWSYSTGD